MKRNLKVRKMVPVLIVLGTSLAIQAFHGQEHQQESAHKVVASNLKSQPNPVLRLAAPSQQNYSNDLADQAAAETYLSSQGVSAENADQFLLKASNKEFNKEPDNAEKIVSPRIPPQLIGATVQTLALRFQLDQDEQREFGQLLIETDPDEALRISVGDEKYEAIKNQERENRELLFRNQVKLQGDSISSRLGLDDSKKVTLKLALAKASAQYYEESLRTLSRHQQGTPMAENEILTWDRVTDAVVSQIATEDQLRLFRELQ